MVWFRICPFFVDKNPLKINLMSLSAGRTTLVVTPLYVYAKRRYPKMEFEFDVGVPDPLLKNDLAICGSNPEVRVG